MTQKWGKEITEGECRSVDAPFNPVDPKPTLSFSLLSPDEIEVIQPLWEQLNQHHAGLPTPFSSTIAARTFEPRLQEFRDKALSGSLRIEIACVTTDSAAIAYCVTSLDADKTGEIDSLFVAPDYRRLGIASTLMQRALDWLRDSGAVAQRVTVLHANEGALAFYRRFGFHPRNVQLEMLQMAQ